MVADAQGKIMYSVKVHKVGSDVLLACCDKSILGSRFSSDELELHVNERFYGGEVVGEEDLIDMISDATVANLLGDGVIDMAVRRGIIEQSAVREICGVKHAQLFVV